MNPIKRTIQPPARRVRVASARRDFFSSRCEGRYESTQDLSLDSNGSNGGLGRSESKRRLGLSNGYKTFLNGDNRTKIKSNRLLDNKGGFDKK